MNGQLSAERAGVPPAGPRPDTPKMHSIGFLYVSCSLTFCGAQGTALSNEKFNIFGGTLLDRDRDDNY